MKKANWILIVGALICLNLGCSTPKIVLNNQLNQTNVEMGIIDSTYWVGPKNGLFRTVSKNGLFGLADQNQRLVTEAKYDRIFGYSEGMVIVCKDNLYGALDSTGKEIIAPTLQFLADYQNGLSYGHTTTGDDVLINKKGQNVVPGKNIQILPLKGSYVEIDQGVCCLLNSEGKTIYNVNTWEFGNKKALFWSERNCAWVTEQIQNTLSIIQEANVSKSYYRVPELCTNFPFILSEGLILVPKLIRNEIKFGYIDEWGKEIIPFLFEDARSFVNGFTCAKQNNLWGVIDSKGNWVIQPEYQNLENVNGSYFVYTQNNLKGIINLENRLIIQANYLRAVYLFDDLFSFLESTDRSKILNDQINKGDIKLSIEQGNTFSSWGCVNIKNFDTILPFVYNEIIPINSKIGVAMKYDYSEIIVPGGSKLNPRTETKVMSSQATVFSQSGEKIKIYDEEKTNTLTIDSKGGSPLIKPTELFKSSGKYIFIGTTMLDNTGTELKDQPLISDIMANCFFSSVITQNTESTAGTSNNPTLVRYGVNSFNGETILPIEFEEIIIAKTVIIAKQNNKYGIYDFSGKLIVPHVYTKIDELRTGVFSVSNDENGAQRFFVNRDNKKINIKY